MAYQAFYRKYRPPNFDGIYGQEHVVRALKNQVETERAGHAYLFSGPRGTGKTSAAKILARALGCHAPENGQPCGVCPACAQEYPVDIMEIDAASHNKVDDVRDMLENVHYLPAVARRRVYIIDEVHMLTTQAFNALLKTLEEPPQHVAFILATTEPHKLPPTVLSRCQRFAFGRIPTGEIMRKLQHIAQSEGIEVDEEGLSAIAVAAEGGMRDAESLLDQCAALCGGQRLDAAQVYAMLGTANRGFYFDMGQALLAGQADRAMAALEGFLAQGGNLQVFGQDICRHLRDVYIAATSAQDKPPVDNIDLHTWKRLQEQARGTVPGKVIHALDILSQLDGTLRYTNNPRVMVELALFRCCREAPSGEQGVLARLEALEKKLENGVMSAPAPEAPKEQPAAREEIPPPPQPPPQGEDLPPWEDEAQPQVQAEEPKQAAQPQRQAPAGAGDAPDPVRLWQATTENVRQRGKASIAAQMELGKGKSIENGVLQVQFLREHSTMADMLTMPRRAQEIEAALQVVAPGIRPEYTVVQYTPDQQTMLEESLKRLPPDVTKIKN